MLRDELGESAIALAGIALGGVFFTAIVVFEPGGPALPVLVASLTLAFAFYAQKRLNASERALRHERNGRNLLEPVLDNLAQPVLIRDARDLECVHANPSMKRVLGVSDMSGVIDPLAQRRTGILRHAIRELAGNGAGTTHGETRVSAPHCTLSLRTRPVYDRDGRLALLLTLAKPVNAPGQTGGNQPLINAIMDSTRQAVVITDPDQRVIAANAAFERITGFRAAEVRNQPPGCLSSALQDAPCHQEILRALATHDCWQGELWDRRKNGEAYRCQLCITAVYDDDGRLTHYVAVFSDTTPDRAGCPDTAFAAGRDPLTGLANLATLLDRTRYALEHAERYRRHFALLYIDINGFSAINSRFGYSGGDRLLKIIANRLQRVVRGEDTVARIGADRFALLLASCGSSSDLERVSEKILQSVTRPLQIEDRRLVVKARAGRIMNSARHTSAEIMLRDAEQALHRAGCEQAHADIQRGTGTPRLNPGLRLRVGLSGPLHVAQ